MLETWRDFVAVVAVVALVAVVAFVIIISPIKNEGDNNIRLFCTDCYFILPEDNRIIIVVVKNRI